jgi:hypothetical protein
VISSLYLLRKGTNKHMPSSCWTTSQLWSLAYCRAQPYQNWVSLGLLKKVNGWWHIQETRSLRSLSFYLEH